MKQRLKEAEDNLLLTAESISREETGADAILKNRKLEVE
jgi:hypothetical protein